MRRLIALCPWLVAWRCARLHTTATARARDRHGTDGSGVRL